MKAIMSSLREFRLSDGIIPRPILADAFLGCSPAEEKPGAVPVV
jgi:hypothetical protein